MSKKWKYLLFRGALLTGGFMTFLMILADVYLLEEKRFDRLYFFQLTLESIFFMIAGTLIALYFWLYPKRTYKFSKEK
jgi:membrane protein implicated in regulation of membrane protease activity